jgi:tetratricopeptide (TPR) repeat protein
MRSQPEVANASESNELVRHTAERAPRVHVTLRTLAILALVLVVYWPALKGGFVWDDLMMVEKNNPIQTGQFSLASVWFRMDFPLTTISFWLEGLLFGRQPAGYHVINALLHALNSVLVWRLLARLRIRGAWLGGALFAVHPVCVASAAWISEQKNTLSLAFYLLSFLWHVRSDECRGAAPGRLQGPTSGVASLGGNPDHAPRTTHHAPRFPFPVSRFTQYASFWYFLSLAAFVLALLSKTSTVMLPVVLLGWLWWRHGHITLRSAARTVPYFALSLGFGLMSLWFQKHQVIVGATVQTEHLPGRVAGASRALWFYLGKAVWPAHLSMIYPRWTIDAASVWSYVPLVLWCVVFATCWRWRGGWGRHALFALGSFAVSLFPALGILDMYYLAISRVSDHFAYLALLAVVGSVAPGLAQVWGGEWLERNPKSGVQNPTSGADPGPRNTQPATRFTFHIPRLIPLAVVIALSVLSFQRARVFATDEGLWRDTLAKNPTAWTAHNNLACILAERQSYGEAAEHFRASLRFNPANAKAHANLGTLLARQGDLAQAESHFTTALQLNPNDGPAHRMYAAYLAGRDRTAEALSHYREALRLWPDDEARLEFAGLLQRTGNTGEAVAQYRRLVAQQPDLVEPLNNLAWLLATSGSDTIRNGADAVQFAERACRLTQFKETLPVGTLAAAYAEAGRFQEAIATAQKAIELASAAGNSQFAAVNQQLLRLYRAGRAYHEPK